MTATCPLCHQEYTSQGNRSMCWACWRTFAADILAHYEALDQEPPPVDPDPDIAEGEY